MPSVFDDPREVLDPPTWAELEQKLGEPILAFAVGDADVLVPQGLLSCCHVVHQPHCRHHTALSLVGCYFTVRLPDGTEQERRPLKQVHEGDVLARPLDLKVAVETARLMAIATAEQQQGLLSTMRFEIWALNLETAEIWRYLHAQQAQALSDGSDAEAIAALPIVVLDPDDPEPIAFVMAHPSFRHARSYADRVLLVPSELGHDDQARYVTQPVWGAAGDVSSAAEAIVRDPQEVT